VQNSAGSHITVDARHSKVGGWNTSRHELSEPLQWSAPSHTPPFNTPVQLTVFGWKASLHELSDPLQ
jgi:hypothetical protein